MLIAPKLPDTVDFVTIGRFGRSYGVQGWIKVISFTDPNTNILNYGRWHAKSSGQWSCLEIESSKLHGQYIIAKLKNIDTPEIVKRYTNIEIAISQNDLPALDPGQVYMYDLPGYQVYNQQNQCLGEVASVFSTGAHDVLSVKSENHYLIPFVRDQFILATDPVNRTITVAWDSFDTA